MEAVAKDLGEFVRCCFAALTFRGIDGFYFLCRLLNSSVSISCGALIYLPAIPNLVF